MPHPAIEFLQLLDPSPNAQFNIETFDDRKGQLRSDELLHRFSGVSHRDAAALIPKLTALNERGAAIYAAVNEFLGHRKLDNLKRVRGIHADFDGVSCAQLEKLRNVLAPTIAVQSSSPGNQHWY